MYVKFIVNLEIMGQTCCCSGFQNLRSCCSESYVSLPEIAERMGSRSRHALHSGCAISNNEGNL